VIVWEILNQITGLISRGLGMSENIILTGFMGSGKDSVAKEISKKTDLAFISMDDYIVLKEKRTINDIFEESGEEYFRKAETETLEVIKNLKNVVVATGGGIVKDKKNREKLSKMGKVFYLYTSLDAVKERLDNDKTRPLIKDKKNIIKIYNERMKKGIYEFADEKIDTSKIPPEQVADKILKISKIEPKTEEESPDLYKLKADSKEYPIYIGCDIFKNNKDLDITLNSDKVAIISNPVVGALYIREIEKRLTDKGIKTLCCIIPDGEKYKNFDTIKKIFDTLLKEKMDRSSGIIALGGGVIGDMGGFVASTLKRGVSLIQIPTTLIAQVDSSIGGKTGFDHPLGKNMIGTFYQPDMILIDIKKLLTLPDKEFRNGMAEVIKYGITHDAELFDILERKQKEIMKRDIMLLKDIISRCVRIKKEVVEEDEKEEKGIREVLNYGHTIGHIIETLTGYSKYSHGEAVAIGMVEEAKLARKESNLATRDFDRVEKLIKKYDLPSSIPDNIQREDMKDCVSQDKKVRKGKIRLPVPTGIGKTIFREVECEKFL
jgi:shikimate kinase / 3-dehydroquinate synthase